MLPDSRLTVIIATRKVNGQWHSWTEELTPRVYNVIYDKDDNISNAKNHIKFKTIAPVRSSWQIDVSHSHTTEIFNAYFSAPETKISIFHMLIHRKRITQFIDA